MLQESDEIVGAVRTRLSAVGGKTASRRSLDERLLLRFPRLVVPLGVWMRLRPQSRLRQLMLARVLRRGYAAVNRRDFAVLLLAFHRSAEFRPRRELVPPDQDAVLVGHDSYVEFGRNWFAAFENLRLDPEEVLDFGDRYLVTVRWRGSGSGSGVSFSEPMFQLFEFRQGRVVRQQDFADRAEALNAAELPE